MNAVNYDNVMREMLTDVHEKRLLLHCCCAPCASYCLEEVAARVRTTVFFYNPNLDCEEEYLLRKRELIRLLGERNEADLLDCDYDAEAFRRVAAGLEDAPEGGARCLQCFALRLDKTAEAAKAGGYDFFATTLTVSPLKDAAAVNRAGFAAQEKYGVTYLPTDFKKRGGYMRSVELSRAYRLYRQNYCGCVYSKNTAID